MEEPSSTQHPTVQAIQAAIQQVVTEGTRYAAELKASDRLIDRNADLLRQDPSNQTLKADQARKIAARDECLNQINTLSARISNQLYQVFLQQQNVSTATTNPSPKEESVDDLKPHDLIKKYHSTSKHDFLSLQRQVLINQQEILKINQDQKALIDSFNLKIHAQKQQITQLQQTVKRQQKTLSTPGVKGNQEEERTNGEETTVVVGRGSVSVPPTPATSAPAPVELEEIRRDIRDMSIHFEQLQTKVITILTKEIPVNLQRSVRLIQQDVDSATHQALTNGHKQINLLVKDLINALESRVSNLERLASSSRSGSTLTPANSGHHHPSSSSDLLKSLPLSDHPMDPNNPPTSKDPRILRRQSGFKPIPPTSDLKSSQTPIKETDCFQQ